jgi:uncharacterized Zn-binding protein involved in type VI secretion
MARTTHGATRARSAPAAARVGDDHHCSHTTNGVPHKGGEIVLPGSRTVFIGRQPAARVGDRCWCEGGAYDVIVEGEPTVLIGGKPAVRRGDATSGGQVVEGDDTVHLGAPRRATRRRGPQ